MVVEAAAQGEATTITKHGRPAAVVVPVEDARRLYSGKRASFADLLLNISEDLETERDATPMRVPDL
jgi:prevent-host-death family protein